RTVETAVCCSAASSKDAGSAMVADADNELLSGRSLLHSSSLSFVMARVAHFLRIKRADLVN
ncbi:hypothetical protein PIB30_114714, partial [Stylosanthes scabra]|nr:hypothetical protein [Stylosanthes scabra]